MSDGLGIEVQERFVRGVARYMGLGDELIDRPGTTVVADASRSGSRRVACYQLNAHAVLPCDPTVRSVTSELADGDVSLSDDDFRSWVATRGGMMLGQSVMKTQARALPTLDDRPGRLHVFDWSRPGDLELVQALVEASAAEDLVEAEVAMDELDDQAVGLVDDGGVLRAYASSRPFAMVPAFGDIGVIVRAGGRAGGWGRAVVAALITELLQPAGVLPLYRCDPVENVGSDRLSAALGFEPALSLSVAVLPE